MNIKLLVSRVTERSKELDMPLTEVSAAAGSKFLIQNWQRAAREGREMHPRIDTLKKIAAELNTSVEWLTGETGDHADAPGFAEPSVEPFRFSEPVLGDMLIRFVAPDASACDTYRASEPFPGFDIASGDLIVTELGGGQKNGDIIVVTLTQNDTATTTLRRLVGDWLIAQDPSQPPEPANPDDGRIGIVATVRGIVRRSERPA